MVPEETLDRAGDGRYGERGEGGTEAGVEPGDGLDPGEGGNLADVVESRAEAAGVAGDAFGQVEVRLDQPGGGRVMGARIGGSGQVRKFVTAADPPAPAVVPAAVRPRRRGDALTAPALGDRPGRVAT